MIDGDEVTQRDIDREPVILAEDEELIVMLLKVDALTLGLNERVTDTDDELD